MLSYIKRGDKMNEKIRKEFIRPEVDITLLKTVDVIYTSTGEGEDNEVDAGKTWGF